MMCYWHNIIYNYNPEKSFGWDVWIGLIGAIAGSIIVALASYYSVMKSIKLSFIKQREKDTDEIKRAQIERIKYLQVLIKGIIIRVENQIKGIKEHAAKVEKDPSGIFSMKRYSFNDIKRIVHQINQEEYFHSYLAVFENNSECIKEICEIFSTLDFFDTKITSLFDNVSNATQLDIDKKRNFGKLKDDILHDLLKIQSESGNLISKDISEKFGEIMKNYIENRKPNGDLKFEIDNFIIPLLTVLPNLSSKIKGLHEILVKIHNANISYEEIIFQRNFEANECKSISKQLEDSLTKLKTISNRLLKYE